MNKKLIAFLYLLMRDEVVPGRVAHITKEVEHLTDADFSNHHLAAYAAEIAQRIS